MEKLNANSIEKINAIVVRHSGKRGPVKLMLHDVQSELGYIPFAAMQAISKGANVSVAEVYGVVTFYAQFTIEPKGKHVINVCMGTACYVKGSQALLDRVCALCDCKVNSTSDNGLFSIDATRCLGACGLAPVAVIDGRVYGKATESLLIDEFIKEAKKEII
ncbi:MAG: NAD(P)H-dependent oxidoreductase subunit E [Erysipelotrichaceae bacterium]